VRHTDSLSHVSANRPKNYWRRPGRSKVNTLQL